MSDKKSYIKTISFKKEFLKEYEFVLKMEQKYGNISRFVCIAIREYMKNHPEEV
jgi:hypothetical protein